VFFHHSPVPSQHVTDSVKRAGFGPFACQCASEQYSITRRAGLSGEGLHIGLSFATIGEIQTA
jgi:hypothetical protein